ncbi:MAG: response regulator [Myxococcales bacterium]|nr:response regulator [Myxococcales bacterium]
MGALDGVTPKDPAAPEHVDNTDQDSTLTALQKRVALLEQVIEGLGVGIAFCDEEGRVELNSAARSALASLADDGEIATAQSKGLSAPGRVQSWFEIPLRDAVESRETSEIEVQRDDELEGDKQRLLCTTLPLYKSETSRAESPLGAVAILEDITLREETLSQMAASEAALDQAIEHSVEASRVKGEFLAMMSHEIRTPMNAILGTAELLTGTFLDAQQREYLDLVLKSADQLLLLVNDVLALAQVEDGEMSVELRDFDLLNMVSNVIKLFAPMAQSKGIALGYRYHFALPRLINADEGKIRQILVNLVSNAIKYTDEGEVSVDIDGIEKEGQRYLQIEVRDSGMGIEHSEQELIFDAFQQASGARGREQGGAGLGLAICRRYSALLDGFIGVSSAPNRGSSFVFESPYSQPENSCPKPEPKVSREHSSTTENRMRVLVVEDNPVNQKLILLQLETLGHTARLADDGASAIENFSDGGFDAVLVSSALPDSSGIELAGRFREMEYSQGLEKTPILGFSTNEGPEYRDDCRAAGMNGFVGKRSGLTRLSQALSQSRRVNTMPMRAPIILNQGTISELRQLSEDPAFLARMVAVFISNATQSIADLRSVAREGNTIAALLICHGLKGACEAIGADAFAQACVAMEKICSTDSPSQEEWLSGLRGIDTAIAAAATALQSETARWK